jgi:DNA-binding NarL/FixJ family response regulator
LPDARQIRKCSRVLLVGEDAEARRDLSRALRDSGRFEIIGEAPTAEKAVPMISGSQPDVILLDAPTEVGTVTTSVRTMLRDAPAARIVVLAPQECERLALETLRAGAVGFLGKDLDLIALVRTLNGVAAGEAAISRRASAWLIARAHEEPRRPMGMRPVKSRLTTREWEVFDLLSAGASKAAIARDLRVTPGTVRAHLRSLFRKLSVDDGCGRPMS